MEAQEMEVTALAMTPVVRTVAARLLHKDKLVAWLTFPGGAPKPMFAEGALTYYKKRLGVAEVPDPVTVFPDSVARAVLVARAAMLHRIAQQ